MNDKKNEQELEILYSKILSDWKSSPYVDKYSTDPQGYTFYYRFDNNDIFTINGRTIRVTICIENKEYSNISDYFREKFDGLFNYIKTSFKEKEKTYNKPKQPIYKQKISSNPTKDKFNKLKNNIKVREEQLKHMSSDDPNKILLQNELDNLKIAVNRMKNKYQFEHLCNFYNYKKD